MYLLPSSHFPSQALSRWCPGDNAIFSTYHGRFQWLFASLSRLWATRRRGPCLSLSKLYPLLLKQCLTLDRCLVDVWCRNVDVDEMWTRKWLLWTSCIVAAAFWIYRGIWSPSCYYLPFIKYWLHSKWCSVKSDMFVYLPFFSQQSFA